MDVNPRIPVFLCILKKTWANLQGAAMCLRQTEAFVSIVLFLNNLTPTLNTQEMVNECTDLSSRIEHAQT